MQPPTTPKLTASKNTALSVVNYQDAYEIAICNACYSTSVTKIYNAHVNVYQLDVNYMYLQFGFYLQGQIKYLHIFTNTISKIPHESKTHLRYKIARQQILKRLEKTFIEPCLKA